ncbi:MAG: hypothetical protein Q8N60_03710, partial [Candidatus Diapherotrites archaeon]|nr:hypothetical protein [Candidatus Diapherotrites archaeon]
MPKQKTLKEAYTECLANGQFRDKEEINIYRIKTMIQLSNTFRESAQDIQKNLAPESQKWSVVHALHYDALRELASAFAQLDNKDIANHQCLFAYLCNKEPELNWDFFEKARTKRNGIEYYGCIATYADFKEM